MIPAGAPLLSAGDWQAVWLTLSLAGATTLLLILFSTPLAWWLSRTPSRWKNVIEAIVAVPLILPPTVLGFYLLVLFSPDHFVGYWWLQITGNTLAFSFTGILIGSIIYSLPFAVQPLLNGFEQFNRQYLEVASTLGAKPADQFFNLVLPVTRSSFLTAAGLSFAHTIGEFGVVLMIGGNIPGETRVLSIALFDHVEVMNYGAAHWLAAGMLLTSFLVLLLISTLRPGREYRV